MVSLRSPFPPDECADRLKAVTEPDRGGLWEDLNRSYAVFARLRGRRVRLRVRHPYTRNAFASIFYGRFEATPRGTLIRGRFRTHPAVLAFVVVWFTFILVVVGSVFILNLGSQPLGSIIVPPLMIGSLAAFIWYLRRRGRADEKDIVQMMQHTLSADP